MDTKKIAKLSMLLSISVVLALIESFIPANTLEGTNSMQIFVYGNDERIMLCSRFDNLGKGASGAAVQCMNIMMGVDEGTGLKEYE